ncbi:MAG TPA: PSD1 and planctomycete cytochrome C domain-containing protein [Candidatus Saccharimonadales bacterium]|nr:PSD1 and planctomycete cytochrome C domain-containing protein [Candidatus Saccharimonadales bacterium]
MGRAPSAFSFFRRLVTTLFVVAAGLCSSPAAQNGVFDDVQPILREHCLKCHGPEKQKGGLRLDIKTKALEGGDSGKAIVPGKGEESLLIKLISGLDHDKVMPPKGGRLSEAQIKILQNWIDAGAIWPESTNQTEHASRSHWAFQAPIRVAPPDVKNMRWVRNPIDAFVLAKLEAHRIQPSAEADRPTLVRRLYLDLLGLLPKPEAVRAFLVDRRQDAYERVVDSLLESPHFGERWGRHWLDVARYADTSGYQVDRFRPYAYVYRNWVIDAFNHDMPFDQFTIEQLAGDLLPNATVAQKTAVGFHRNTLMNHEDGVDAQEFICKAKVDRVSTTGNVWLGLTVGCAECHSHKYDPISQKEFYQLYAFFNNTEEQDITAIQAPELERYTLRKKACDEELAKVQAALATNKTEALQAEWERQVQLPATPWVLMTSTNYYTTDGTTLRLEKDGSFRALGRIRPFDTYVVEASANITGVTGFRLEMLPATGKPSRKGQGNSILAEFAVSVTQSNGNSRRMVLQHAAADFSAREFPVSAAIDGNFTNGWSFSPETNRRHVAVFESREKVDVAPGEKLVFKLSQKNGAAPARFRISATTAPAPLGPDWLPDNIVKALNTPVGSRSAGQKKELAKYYREEVNPTTSSLTRQIESIASRTPTYQQALAQSFVEGTNCRPTFVHVRGDFLRHGEQVQPGVIGALNSFRSRSPKPDRLDLAHWIMDPANPLTSRVAVNRMWQHLFGRGLVESIGDFGTRGGKPSHPELLDWLATEFPRLGWSRKSFIKMVLMSSTYRQSSFVRSDLLEYDPENVLLARQGRFRLESEIVRDIYLCAGGKLNDEIGGPSIRPPTTESFRNLGNAGAFTWADTETIEKYKRGLYVLTQRTVPYPVSMTFDGPNSAETCPRRERSNTPLQALTLLNNPVFMEAAQGLGLRIQQETAGSPRKKIEHGFELCLSREPSQQELSCLERLYEQNLALTRRNPASAEKIAGAGLSEPLELSETAALVSVAQVILNLDEFFNRE